MMRELLMISTEYFSGILKNSKIVINPLGKINAKGIQLILNINKNIERNTNNVKQIPIAHRTVL